MIRPARRLIVALFLITVAASCAPTRHSTVEPTGLLLTWQDDPTTTITIDWHTAPGAEQAGGVLAYRRAEAWPGFWRAAQAESFAFPYSDRTVHRAQLTNLQPGSDYEFQLPTGERTFRFRTMPAHLDEPLRFAAGGDVRHRQEWMERTNRVAMKYEPEFIVWGGDLAYADGREDRVHRWYEFFDAMMNTLVTEEGRVIPIIVGLGNHEVLDHLYHRAEDYEQTDAFRAGWAPYFFELFAFPGQPGYGVLDFADYLSIVMLDTAHANPVTGEQTEWLEPVLDERRGRFTHIIPVQHIPAYPSVRAFDGSEQSIWGSVSQQIREYWSPLFEQAGVRLVLENHDHAYKRTPPIKAEQVSEDGIVYIGDGAWGVNIREVHDVDETWYLERAQTIRHGLIVTLEGESIHVLAVSEEGETIDETRIAAPPHHAEARATSE